MPNDRRERSGVAIGLDDQTMFRLVVVRELLSAGIDASDGPLPVDRMRAILHLDHAVELLLLVLLQKVGVERRSNEGVPVMVNHLVKAQPTLASHREPMEKSRRLRDRVQHDGLIPSPEDVRRAVLDTEAFVRAAVREILGCELEALTLTSLLRDGEARGRLQRAEELLTSGQLAQACEEAAVAFALGSARILAGSMRTRGRRFGYEAARRLLDAVGEAARGAVRGRLRNTDLSEFAYEFETQLRHPAFSVSETFEAIERRLFFAEAGISLRELRRFEDVTPHVVLTFGGHQVFPKNAWAPSPQDVAFAIDFATRALLTLERVTDDRAAVRSGSAVGEPNAPEEDAAP